MNYAIEEGEEELPEMQYSDNLMEALRSEKKSVSELILLMDDMITNLQEHMDGEDGEEGEGEGKDESNETEDEDNFQDAREEDGYITSKIRDAAVDSKGGTTTVAVPRPHREEGA